MEREESTDAGPAVQSQRGRVQVMKDFIEKQIEASERLFNLMMQDHKDRMKDATLWAEMNAGLMAKLDQRDAEIANLRCRVKELEDKLTGA